MKDLISIIWLYFIGAVLALISELLRLFLKDLLLENANDSKHDLIKSIVKSVVCQL